MDWTIPGSNPAGTRDFSLLQNVHTSSGAKTAYWSKAGGFFPGVILAIATRLWTGRSQDRIPAGTRDFFSSAECLH